MKCWVQIVDSQGAAYKGSTATKISIDDDADIDDLGVAVKLNYPKMLSSFEASQLTVYKSMDYIHNSQPFEVDCPISGLGNIKDKALVVVVPEGSQQGMIIQLL